MNSSHPVQCQLAGRCNCVWIECIRPGSNLFSLHLIQVFWSLLPSLALCMRISHSLCSIQSVNISSISSKNDPTCTASSYHLFFLICFGFDVKVFTFLATYLALRWGTRDNGSLTVVTQKDVAAQSVSTNLTHQHLSILSRVYLTRGVRLDSFFFVFFFFLGFVLALLGRFHVGAIFRLV